MNTIYTCGIKINPLSVKEILAYTTEWLEQGKKGLQLTGVNIEQIALLKKNKEFGSYLNSSDIVNIDGTIVSMYLKLKGFKLNGRTLCADVFEAFLKYASENNKSIYLLGASQETIEQLVSNLKGTYPGLRIIGYHNGFFNDEKMIVDDIASKAPDFLFIGMPSPFKERFITQYKGVLNTGVCYGVGGMFDILAGKVKRAPEKIQKMGLEWFYRITQNPVGHTKRVFRALIPSICVFGKHLFEKKRQEI